MELPEFAAHLSHCLFLKFKSFKRCTVPIFWKKSWICFRYYYHHPDEYYPIRPVAVTCCPF